MRTRLYSVEEVARILGLHVRTVRGYVRDGRLGAVRIGKQYRIAEEDLLEFTTGRTPDSHRVVVMPRVSVTAVVQIEPASREVMDRISTHLVAAATSRSGRDHHLDIHTVFDPDRDSLKVFVVGDASTTAEAIALIDTLTKDE